MNLRDKICGMDRMEDGKFSGCNHCFTAAAATVADKIDTFLHIVPELD
jgi:hypothetical protein